jgi:glycosyltransferase involved in cell wall biosynthesis
MAQQLRALGINATLVVITSAHPLSERLDDTDTPVIELGLPRGRQLIRVARRYAAVLRHVGPDGALLMTSGYMATIGRIGGYRGPLVGVEHGQVLQTSNTRRRRWMELVDLFVGAHCLDAQVAVSPFMLGELEQIPHRPGATVIPNGVDVDRYCPQRPIFSDCAVLTVGWAGRLIEGKGVDDLLRASARISSHPRPFQILIAGDGPERQRLASLAADVAPPGTVKFIGPCQDMPGFWNRCDLAVATSNQFVESFGLAPLEAAACGRPVVATSNGGFVDVVKDGETGRIVTPGDVDGLAAAISQYLTDHELARQHGDRGRARAAASFEISSCATAYLDLLGELAEHRA